MRIFTVTVVVLLLAGLAVAAFAGPRFDRDSFERDRDRMAEQSEADNPDKMTLNERDRDRLRAHDPEDAAMRQDRDRLRAHDPEDATMRQDRDRLRTHDPGCDRLEEQERVEHRNERGSENEPVRARERRID